MKTIEAKVIILNLYVYPNVTKAIDMFQRSRLTFDLSAKAAHIGVSSIYSNIVFSETTKPIDLNFHMKTSYDNIAKIIQMILVT